VSEPRRNAFWRYAIKLLGPCLLVYVLYRIDVRVLWSHITQVNVPLYAGACAVTLVTLFVRSLRWRAMVTANPGAELGVFRGYLYCWAAAFLGAATPGRVGELYKVAYLRGGGLSFGRAAATVVADRLLDVLCPVCLALAGALVFHRRFGAALQTSVMAIILILLAGAGLMAIYAFRERWRPFVLKSVARLTGQTAKEHIERGGAEFMLAIKSIRAPRWTACTLLTVIAWTLYCAQRILIAEAVGLEIDALYFAFAFIVVAVVSALPISIIGIGTRDVTLAYLLAFVGVTPEQAITLSSLILLVMLLVTLVGFLVFMALPNPRSRSASAESGDR